MKWILFKSASAFDAPSALSLASIAASALAAAACATGGHSGSGVIAAEAGAIESVRLDLVGGSAASGGEACPDQASAAAPARAILAGASACARAKDWARTEKLAAELARRDLSSPWPPYLMSVAADAAGDAPRALWMAELAQKKAGRDVALFRYQRGRALLAVGMSDEGFAEIRAASRSEPRLIEAHVFVGESFLRDLDPKKAEESFRRALEAEPKNARAARGLAAALRAQGDEAGANRALAEAGQSPVSSKPERGPSGKGAGR